MKKKPSKQLVFKIKDQSPRRKKEELDLKSNKQSKKSSKKKKSKSGSRNKRSSLIGFQNFMDTTSDFNFNFTINDDEEEEESPNKTKEIQSFFSKSPTPLKKPEIVKNDPPSFSNIKDTGKKSRKKSKEVKKKVKSENEVFSNFSIGMDHDIELSYEDAQKINQRPLEERPIHLSYYLFKKVRDIIEGKIGEMEDKEDAVRVRAECK